MYYQELAWRLESNHTVPFHQTIKYLNTLPSSPFLCTLQRKPRPKTPKEGKKWLPRSHREAAATTKHPLRNQNHLLIPVQGSRFQPRTRTAYAVSYSTPQPPRLYKPPLLITLTLSLKLKKLKSLRIFTRNSPVKASLMIILNSLFLLSR